MVRYVDLIKDVEETTADPAVLHPPAAKIAWESRRKPAQRIAESQAASDKETYLSLRQHLLMIKASLLDKRNFDVEPLKELVRNIVGEWDMVDRLYHYTIRFGHEEDFTASHSINTMIYALKMGRGLDYPREDLEALGLAALLHDVGMFTVPESIVKKPGSLTGEETDRIREHTDIGRECLSAWMREMPFLSRVAHEHHEREDGSGYPRGMKGDEISEYAKIVGLADTYDAMTHDRPHRRAISVRELIDTKNRSFPSRVMKAFLEQISFYPVGSVIKLNNRMVGRVVATNTGQPLRPVVKILIDADGNPVTDEKTVNLLGNPIVWVAGPVPEKEMPRLEP
ncbi:MAG TPA: HD domain-containing phosphohydrolase [Syntrophales bacterium]|nr:HD domain-containing phosphohydrolase [Syntrophales bacterium]